jgi:calcium-dependent protein kinase
MDTYLDAVKENKSSPSVDAPQLKLIDFGFARVWDPSRLMKTACGSAEYVSPDVLHGEGYTSKTDLWSLGVIVWMLLAGYPPFHGQKQSMMAKIKAAQPDWSHQSRWRNVTQDAKDFVKKLLVRDPETRLDAEAALQHPWLTLTVPQPEYPLVSPVWSMQRYAAGSKVRRAALQMLVQQMDWKQTDKLRKAFKSMDRNCEGWITADSFQDLIDEQTQRTVFDQISNECAFKQDEVQNPRELFASLDANRDQRIYYSEFMAATAKVCRQNHKQVLKATFSRFDADGSGSIGLEDLRSVLGKTFEGVDVSELLLEAQPQGLEISFEEFVEAITLGDSAEAVGAISPTKGRLGLLSTVSAL